MTVFKIPFWKSITSYLFVVYGIITVLLVAIFSILVFENQLDLIAENALYSALQTGDRIHSEADSHSQKYGFRQMNELTAILSENIADEKDRRISRLIVYNDKGESIYPENEKNIDLDILRNIQTAITKRDFESKLFHHIIDFNKREITLFIPFSADDKTAIIKADILVSSIDEQLDYLQRQAMILLISVLILHGGFIVYAYRLIIRPFNILTESVHRISRGDFQVTFPHFKGFEFFKLSEEIQQMGYAVRDMQDSARSASPLTSLPGNVEIEKKLRSLIENKEEYCVIYGDLDNFKAYNDYYGFSKGDDVILYTRDIFLQTIKEKKIPNVFLGHQGGDDFVLTCNKNCWESLAAECIKLFDEKIGDFYSEDDRERGYIISVNRNGDTKKFPLVSLSLAVVTTETRNFLSVGQIAKVSSEMKKYVKGIEGSAFAIDRRTD